jgi:hypothetical protein
VIKERVASQGHPLAHSVGERANHGAIWWRKRPAQLLNPISLSPTQKKLRKGGVEALISPKIVVFALFLLMGFANFEFSLMCILFNISLV